MTEIPSIKSSAQARLLIYKLIKGKITAIERRLLESNSTLWLRVLEILEHEITLNSHIQSDQIALNQAFFYIERGSKEGFKKQLLCLTGKELWIGTPPTDLLNVFILEHSKLIHSIQREQLDKMSHVLHKGIREGRLLKDLTKDIHKSTALSKRRAQLIARNGPLQYSGALTRHYQESAGIKQYRWQTSKDERVRKSHQDKNGKIYDWSESGPHPRSEVNCRCDAIPLVH